MSQARVTLTIGGRRISVPCRAGDQERLEAAAKALEPEARALGGRFSSIDDAAFFAALALELAAAPRQETAAAVADAVDQAAYRIAQLVRRLP